MGRITSSTGLITGIPIEDTVNKLMALAQQPRDLIKARNDDLTKQQSALDAIGSRLLAFQFAVNKLKATSVYKTRDVSSSDAADLVATAPASGTASIGSFSVLPARAASSQSLVSQRFDALGDDLGDGTLRFGFGGFVDQGISLDQLNSGAGVQRGKIKVTDRSGVSAVIDLRTARTVDDVLDAINSNSDVSITASAQGDSFVLTDGSGGSGNLVVQEVGGGTTAASLGLAGISTTADSVTGADVFRLSAGTKLQTLNDGNGVRVTAAGVKDLDVELSDGTSLQIDLAGATTLGDVITKINAASPTKLSAAVGPDGNRLQLQDLSGGGGTFQIDNGAASTAAEDLGIKGTGSAGTLTGKRVVAGLRDSLLSSLDGGKGIGPLGDIQITDRSGDPATIDLSSAETLGDVIKLINDSPIDVQASFNSARNGIVLTDSSGGSGNLIVANADGTNSATKLNIAINSAVGSTNSGALHRQTLSKATLLSSLNGGKGATLGDLQITNAAGVKKSVDLNPLGNEAKTVGDVIDRINLANAGVTARINDTGDGILIASTGGGTGSIAVKDLSGSIAQSLNLTRASRTLTVDGDPTTAIDGASSFEVDLSDLSFNSTAVPLSSLNGGDGVAAGTFIIESSTPGQNIPIDLKGTDSGVTTVGQLVDAINAKSSAQGFGITAAVNAAGNGIQLTDSSGGTGKLKVRDVNSTTAADLKLAGEGVETNGDQIINGSGAFFATSGAQSGLAALAARVNDLKAGVTASAVFDGAGYRLSLSVDATGDANQLLIDSGGTNLNFDEVHKGQDALLLYGDLNSPTGGVLLSSADGNFPGSVGGVDLQVKNASTTPVTVNVTQSSASLTSAVKDIVTAYNALRKDLGTLTSFDPDALTTGLLFGTNEALQVDSRLSRALTNRYSGLGSFQSLEQIGLSVKSDGTIEVDNTKLSAAFDKDPAALQKFLSDADNGVAVKLAKTVDSLAGADNSVIANRSDSIKDTIAANQLRIDRMDDLLDKQKERLLAQFTQLESIIAQLQQSQTALASFQPIAPLTASN